MLPEVDFVMDGVTFEKIKKRKLYANRCASVAFEAIDFVGRGPRAGLKRDFNPAFDMAKGMVSRPGGGVLWVPKWVVEAAWLKDQHLGLHGGVQEEGIPEWVKFQY